MDQLLITFLTWQFLLFCLSLAAVIEVLRRFVEYYEKDVKDLKMWNELILPSLPVFMGGFLGAVLKAFPYPEGFATIGPRILFGLVAGLLSTYVYRALKAFIRGFIAMKSGSDLENQNNSDHSHEHDHDSFAIDDSQVEAVRETIRKDPMVPNVEIKSDSQ